MNDNKVPTINRYGSTLCVSVLSRGHHQALRILMYCMYAMVSCSLQRIGVAYGYHTVGISMPFTFYLALPLLQIDVA